MASPNAKISRSWAEIAKTPVKITTCPQTPSKARTKSYKAKPKYTKKALIEKRNTLTGQYSDIMLKILHYVPFINQIRLWQTGDHTLQRLYKACRKNSTTVLDFDKDFCLELLRSSAENVKLKSGKYTTNGWRTSKGEIDIFEKVPYPPIFTKIPYWIRFHRVVFHKFSPIVSGNHQIEYDSDPELKLQHENLIVRFTLPFEKHDALLYTTSSIKSLRDLLVRSASTLTDVETFKSYKWMFDMLSEKESDDVSAQKIFSKLVDFRCGHDNKFCVGNTVLKSNNCVCSHHCMRLATKTFLMGYLYYSSNKATFSFPNAETISEVRLSHKLHFPQVESCASLLTEQIPNLQIVEVTLYDVPCLSVYVHYLNMYSSNQPILPKILYIRTPLVEPLDLVTMKFFAPTTRSGKHICDFVINFISKIHSLGFGLKIESDF
jgi:hypothetical protein